MRSTVTPYPVDRYLDTSRKTNDMVNIIDSDIWNPEPALRPEDEIMLRKLHDMLQSTADDLKLLSGELKKYHEPGVQVKTLPMPLDEEFNEKVRIEEAVRAKFYDNKIVTSAQRPSAIIGEKINNCTLQSLHKTQRRNAYCQASDLTTLKKPIKKNLQISRTKTMEISEKSDNKKGAETTVDCIEANGKLRKCNSAVAYDEFSHKYVQPNIIKFPQKSLQIQEMPSINIRSELRLQKVLQLDILPESSEILPQQAAQQNALVIEMQHENLLKQKDETPIQVDDREDVVNTMKIRPTLRKVSTMSTYESSESNNISSSSHNKLPGSSRLETKVLQKAKKNIKSNKKSVRPQAYVDEWRKKLNTIYGKQIDTKSQETKRKKLSFKKLTKNSPASILMTEDKYKNNQNQFKAKLNNREYIPYSKLTLGGVNVSDVEREISNIPNKNNIVLSPILDKILSRENSFHNDSPQNNSYKDAKILTTSDENLMQEVLDIEMKVSNTLKENNNNKQSVVDLQNNVDDSNNEIESYADDFEDEKSDVSVDANASPPEISQSDENLRTYPSIKIDNNMVIERINEANENNCNRTYNKLPNLSFKNTVDIFEFVHSVDTQDIGTQSNHSKKITPKETQTSPRNGNPGVHPIHNDLWPSLNPREDIEKMLKLEKEFIKKLILDEYGDLLEETLNKPSTSGICDKNVTASQKITQTSPAHVKNVMTSPRNVKTRSTSPVMVSVNVNQQTSPVAFVANEALKEVVENESDLGISANLSSSRFSLRLPKSSQEVFLNLEDNERNKQKYKKVNTLRKSVISSTSSGEGDYSSSDLSSLGEMNKKFERLKKNGVLSISEISSSSSSSKYGSDASCGILPLRSEGEASVDPLSQKSVKVSKSEGEVSVGQLRYLKRNR